MVKLFMLQQITAQIHKLLLKSGKTVAVAESCTGGLISKMLTDLPGSSSYFLLGVISYSNEAKSRVLRVPEKLITQHGAVSKEVALKMCAEVRKISQADLAISITGIAGPSGGSKDKPVGTVFIAAEGKKNRVCRKFRFSGTRQTIRRHSCLKALELLRKVI